MRSTTILKTFCFAIFFCCTSRFTFGQQAKEFHEFRNNIVYGSAGPFIFYEDLFLVEGCYERKIVQNMWNSGISSFVQLGYGVERTWHVVDDFSIVRLGILGGRGAHHYEGSFGAMVDIPGSEHINWSPVPSFNAGWRFETPKPKGRFIARAGVGFPEFIYASVGFGF